MRRGLTKFIASITVGMIIMWILMACLGSLTDGLFADLVVNMLGALPFGDKIGTLSANILSGLAGTTIDVGTYVVGSATRRTLLEFMREFCKLCLNSMAFAALIAAVDLWLDADDMKTGWYLATKIVWHLGASVLCTLVVNLILTFAFAQLQSLGIVPGSILTGLITLMAVGGGMAVAIVLAASNTLVIIALCFLKVVILNVINLFVTEVALTTLLIAFSERLYLRAVGFLGGWIIVMIVLAAVAMMIDGAIGLD